MKRLKSIGAFWYDFVVGDDWRVATVVVLALALTALLVRALRLVRLRQFSLPNLLAGETLAPEFFQEAVIPDNLCPAIERALTDTALREHLQHRFRAIHESLRADGAARAAQTVLALLDAREEGQLC